MKRAYRITRFILVSLLSLAVGIPLLLYVLLCLGPVQDAIRNVACKQLSDYLGADVNIGRLHVEPFNRVELADVSIVLEGDTVLAASELNAGISVRNLLLGGRIVVTDVELMQPDIRLWRTTADSPLNVQPILDRLKGEEGKPPTAFDLAVHTVVLRGGKGAYDVLSEPCKPTFDLNHLAVSDLRADLTAPRISNDKVLVSLKRLNFHERSGLTLRNLAADVVYTPDSLQIDGLELALPRSSLRFADMVLRLKDSHKISDIEVLDGSKLNPADFEAFVPQLAMLDTDVSLSADVGLYTDSLSVKSLTVGVPDHGTSLSVRGDASMKGATVPGFAIGINGSKALPIIEAFHPLPEKQRTLIGALGDVSFTGSASWMHPRDVSLNGVLATALGSADIDASFAANRLSGMIDASELNLESLLPGSGLGMADFAATFNLSQRRGHAAVTVDRIGWRGHDFHNIDAAVAYEGKSYKAAVSIDDSLAVADLHAELNLTPGAFLASINADVDRLQPNELGLWQKYPGYVASGGIHGEFSGVDPLHPVGELLLSDLRFTDGEGNGLIEAPARLTADLSEGGEQHITFESDIIDISARGTFNLATIGPAASNLLADAMPEIFTHQVIPQSDGNDFTLQATVHDDAPLFEFMRLPVKFLYPITLNGEMSQSAGKASLIVSAPYIQSGNSLISHSKIEATLGSKSKLKAHTKLPSKFGDMELNLDANLSNGFGHATLALNDITTDAYSGRIDMAIRPAVDGADLQVEESVFNFGNMNWTITPTQIGVHHGVTDIRGLTLRCPGQELSIRGKVSANADDRLTLKLDHINLDDVFAALRMNDVVQFGGTATGTIVGSGLLSREPVIQTEDLYVKDLAYSHCVMGNGRLMSRWNNETHGVEIRANIEGRVAGGGMTVDGVIFPMTQELDFKFHAKHAPMGFLHTFMSAWASKVGGYASGDAHLYGNFKLVDLTGDFFAENFALTVGFTNVTYYATDSIHIRPGKIALDGINIHDANGRSAKVWGELTHNYFMDPRFEFRITDMDRMLAYDVQPTIDSFWSGKIYANGNVTISGVPGHCDINAEVTTAPNSEFTFELSEDESAMEYNFLTFHDATPRPVADSVMLTPGSPELDKLMADRVKKEAAKAMLTNYDFNLQMDLTPDIKMTLVMDPVAGDKITAYGSGHVGLLYGSGNEEMRLYGEYAIDRGDYNFTLQDIVIKNFTIRPGSTVAFHGDPYDAILDISAIYQLNANLTDLDESFLTDKEVQRTSVPVYAVLNVDGHLQDPQISFDLDFPTLTSDVKRKVKSIVNTEEMMNRQIIYLLALNRFYTPEYMSATKGNELMSVASGTISSQLSNILGQLSDKISVAPSLRSDAGDFSDLEFDVALSSTLLNNRLLLNGNFGYRDKSLNTVNTQFVGDLDVEYLLTRSGNWRLKAYNHFNDRNLYVKTALTTQGLGLVFKHDFDRLFFLKPRKPQPPKND